MREATAMNIMSYLFFNGNCQEALSFYEKTLGAVIGGVMRNRDVSDATMRMPGSDDLIMNAIVTIGDTTLMVSDEPAASYTKPSGHRLHLEADSIVDAERIFAALGEGGSVGMPMSETFWAERFGMVTDRFNTPWMVSYTGRMQQ
jgi:PhnB protein